MKKNRIEPTAGDERGPRKWGEKALIQFKRKYIEGYTDNDRQTAYAKLLIATSSSPSDLTFKTIFDNSYEAVAKYIERVVEYECDVRTLIENQPSSRKIFSTYALLLRFLREYHDLGHLDQAFMAELAATGQLVANAGRSRKPLYANPRSLLFGLYSLNYSFCPGGEEAMRYKRLRGRQTQTSVLKLMDVFAQEWANYGGHLDYGANHDNFIGFYTTFLSHINFRISLQWIETGIRDLVLEREGRPGAVWEVAFNPLPNTPNKAEGHSEDALTKAGNTGATDTKKVDTGRTHRDIVTAALKGRVALGTPKPSSAKSKTPAI